MTDMTFKDTHKRETTLFISWIELQVMLKRHYAKRLAEEGLMVVGSEIEFNIKIEQEKEGMVGNSYNVDKWNVRISGVQTFLKPEAEDAS